MFRDSSRIVRMLLVAVVLVASWGCCSSMPRNHLILVGSGQEAQVGVPVLSRQRGHQMVWRSLDGTTGIEVIFNLTSGQLPPFKNMSCTGTSCAVPCVPSSTICSSGQINPDLVLPTSGVHYSYGMSLIGAPAADPKIIIKP